MQGTEPTDRVQSSRPRRWTLFALSGSSPSTDSRGRAGGCVSNGHQLVGATVKQWRSRSVKRPAFLSARSPPNRGLRRADWAGRAAPLAFSTARRIADPRGGVAVAGGANPCRTRGKGGAPIGSLRSGLLSNNRARGFAWPMNGSPTWDRTRDIVINSHALCQLSYRKHRSYNPVSNGFKLLCFLQCRPTTRVAMTKTSLWVILSALVVLGLFLANRPASAQSSKGNGEVACACNASKCCCATPGYTGVSMSCQ